MTKTRPYRKLIGGVLRDFSPGMKKYPDGDLRRPSIARLAAYQDYWRSRRTELGIEFACANMAVPAWTRMFALA